MLKTIFIWPLSYRSCMLEATRERYAKPFNVETWLVVLTELEATTKRLQLRLTVKTDQGDFKWETSGWEGEKVVQVGQVSKTS